jgi:two-component system, cell cycle sensor histidine kinase and response regulator CckA
MGEYRRFALLVFVIIGPLLVVGASAGHAAQAETKEVVAAVARDFYPEYVADAEGRPGGFSIDLMNTVAKRAGLSVTYRVFESWSDLIAALERGDADLIPVASVTRAREGRMLFTRPVVTSPASLFVRQDTDDVRGVSDLAGRRVGVIAGGVSEELLSGREASARLVPYARLQDALFGLMSGEVDALVSFQSSVWKVSERVRLADRIKVVGYPLTEVKRAVAVRRDLPALRDRLDAAVADFLNSSEYRKLYSEWYAAAPAFWNPGRIGWLAGASTALLLLGMLVWQSLLLRAESRQFAESALRKLPGERTAVEFPSRAISQTCGLLALALGLAVLFGWTFDVATLKTMLPGLFAMQPWAAMAIALAGGALLAATAPGRIAAAVSTALAGMVVIIGLQTLLQYATGLDLGTDWWLFPTDVSNQPGHPHPGRVAEATSIAFALLGTTLLLTRIDRAWTRAVFSTIGTFGLLLMAAPLVGYLIGAGTLQTAFFFTPIAVHAALGLVVLFLGALALRPDTGWMALLSGDTPGAASARMLLPVAVAGPVLVAWLFNSGREAGLYGPEFQVGLITLATIALLGNALLWNAARLDRLHRARLAGAEALRESEARYRTVGDRMRALLDASQDEILLLSTEGVVLAINKTAERLAEKMGGSTPVSAHLDRLLPQDQVELRMTIVRQVATTATLVHCEVPIRSRWFEFWFYPVLQSDKPVSEVAVYAREITEQKKSQADLSKLFQAIQQSPTSVVITDRDGKIEYVNPKFTDVTGYTPAEAIGKNPRILKSGHTAPEQYAQLWKTISAGRVWRGELLNKKKNGELFWELASIAPVKEGDRITNFVAVKEDITQRKEVEEQLRQSQKMQAVGQLTGGIAHDFNNLLAIIIGNVQLLGERVSGDAKTREFLDDALWSARRGGELIDRLLAFARKHPLKPAVIDLNEVVRGVTELLHRTLGASIRIEESLAPNLWKTFADRGQLESALVNLAINSRDAMRSAGTLTLETRNAVLNEDYAEQYEEVTAGEYVLLAVGDTGTGMSPEIMQRVFEPFFTTKEVGQGSGLGLSMVYGFVKQSGGHISIYSRVGQGTCVQLYLPRAPSSPAGREEDLPDVFPEDLGNKVVLVVEDEPKLRKVAVKMLDRLGLQSLQVETAKDALELLADIHIDVLFTDIELPGGMNGTELAEAAHHLYPELKVLFTTGYTRETTRHERGLHERAPCLLKPYSHQELARELKALLAPSVH